MTWVALIEIAVGLGLILWKKPNRQTSIRYFLAGILLIVFGALRILIF